jgi:hypothetical protein
VGAWIHLPTFMKTDQIGPVRFVGLPKIDQIKPRENRTEIENRSINQKNHLVFDKTDRFFVFKPNF